MKTIFENKFTYTKKYYKEYYLCSIFKRPILLFLNIIIGINLILHILAILLPNFFTLTYKEIIGYIGSDLIILCIEIGVYLDKVIITYKRDLEMNQGNPINNKVCITEGNIEILPDVGKSINIDLNNIEKIIKTKNYYIFITKARLTIALKKDSFIKGTEEEFITFLKKKKIKIGRIF